MKYANAPRKISAQSIFLKYPLDMMIRGRPWADVCSRNCDATWPIDTSSASTGSGGGETLVPGGGAL